jgi:hypothetical protein
MTVKMELVEERAAEEAILSKLKEKEEPSLPSAVFNYIASSGKMHITSQLVRRAFWYLLDDGQIEFTPDNYIRIKTK